MVLMRSLIKRSSSPSLSTTTYSGRHRDNTAAGLTRANLREDLAQRGLMKPGRHRAA